MKHRDYSRCVRLTVEQIVQLAAKLPDATAAQKKKLTDRLIRGWYGAAKPRKPKSLEKKT